MTTNPENHQAPEQGTVEDRIEKLQAKMEPIRLAWSIAENLRDLVRLLPHADEATKTLVADLLRSTDVTPETAERRLLDFAGQIEDSHPVEPANGGEKQAVWEMVVDQARDMSSRDIAEMLIQRYTEADWRAEADELALYDGE